MYCTTNKGSKTMYVRGVESGVCGFYTTVYRVILLMSEVSKVDRELSIQSNVTHVKGVESSSINTIRAVMLCIYVKGVERSSKWSYSSLLITFLIFNRFSIRKKFWKAKT